MISNKGRNNKGKTTSTDVEHTQRKTEPGTRELKRAMAKKAKRQKTSMVDDHKEHSILALDT